MLSQFRRARHLAIFVCSIIIGMAKWLHSVSVMNLKNAHQLLVRLSWPIRSIHLCILCTRYQSLQVFVKVWEPQGYPDCSGMRILCLISAQRPVTWRGPFQKGTRSFLSCDCAIMSPFLDLFWNDNSADHIVVIHLSVNSQLLNHPFIKSSPPHCTLVAQFYEQILLSKSDLTYLHPDIYGIQYPFSSLFRLAGLSLPSLFWLIWIPISSRTFSSKSILTYPYPDLRWDLYGISQYPFSSRSNLHFQ